MITQDIVTEALKTVVYPGFEKDIVSYGFVKQIAVEGDSVALRVEIPSSSGKAAEELYETLTKRLKSLGVEKINIDIKQPNLKGEAPKMGKNLAPHIEHFVMVSSGKGGVGKSTTTVNIAVALAQQGKKVGILDADIYGPNIPRMMGLGDKKPEIKDNKVTPLESFGVEVMSMGLLYEQNQSLIWRGPMIMRAIEQLIRDVSWGELDVLVVDMPPGTGDAQLTLAQSVPVSAGVTVTTPQSVSLDDSIRSLDMFKKLKIPLGGIVENMSGFVCPESGKEYNIFGKGTVAAVAKEFDTELLGEVPIELSIREGGDEGKPVVYFHPSSKSAKEYQKMADRLWSKIIEAKEDGTISNSSIQPTTDGKSACSS